MKTTKEIFEDFIYDGNREPYTATIEVIYNRDFGIFKFDCTSPSIAEVNESTFICWDKNEIKIDFDSAIIDYPTSDFCEIYIDENIRIMIYWSKE